MKKKLQLFAVFLGISLGVQAQVYDSTITQNYSVDGATLTFNFDITGADLNAIVGTPIVEIMYDGDFGDPFETITLRNEANNTLGIGGNLGFDCLGTITSHDFGSAYNLSSLQAHGADNILSFTTTNSTDVNTFCANNVVSVRLRIEWCSTTTPANITTIGTSLCHTDPLVVLQGTPSEGVFSGPGVTDSLFNPLSAGIGEHILEYSVLDTMLGCTTRDYVTFVVGEFTLYTGNTVVCSGDSTTLEFDQTVAIYVDSLGTILHSSGETFTSPIITSDTTFYAFPADVDYADVEIQTIDQMVFDIVDHNAITGDDRSGVAVTKNHVYFVGDSYTGRYNLDLTGGISLPVRDGIFSDMSNGQLYTLYNNITNTTPQNNYSINSLREMDTSLNILSNEIVLSQTIILGYGSGIFAGAGFVILYSSNTQEWYHVTIPSGTVSVLGTAPGNFYTSENWASWGVASYDGTDFSVIYRSNVGQQWDRRNMTTFNTTVFSTFTNLSDMATIAYSPDLQRFYFHHEYNAQFGGSSETGGWISGSSTFAAHSPVITGGCVTEIRLSNPSFDLGPDTILCGSLYSIYAGNGHSSYTWNGVNNNFNVFTVNQPGTYTCETVDSLGCVLSDSIEILLNELETLNIPDTTNCGSNAVVLDATVTGATYMWQDGSTNPTFTAAMPGTYTVDVTTACGTETETVEVFMDELETLDMQDTTNCGGNAVILDATVNGATYLWQDGSTNSVFVATMPGTYTVDVTAICGTVSETVEVFMDELETIDIPDTSICGGNTVVLDATVNGATYLWQDGSTNATFTVTAPGTYTVEVTATCGTVTEVIDVSDCTGLNDLVQGSVSIYPNPNQDRALTVSIEGVEGEIENISIYDMKGSIVLTENIYAHTNHVQRFDLSNLESGMYMVKITVAKGTIESKLIVQ